MNDYRAYVDMDYNAIYHHGIKGQRWGERNGPPYPLDREDHSIREQVAQANPETYTYKRTRSSDRNKYYEKHSKKYVVNKYGQPVTERKGISGAITNSVHKKRVKKFMKAGMTRQDAERKASSMDNRTQKAIKTGMTVGMVALGGILAYKMGKEYFKTNKDFYIRRGTKMQTLASTSDRFDTVRNSKDLAGSMFFEAHNPADKAFYSFMFNRPEKVGNRTLLKYKNINVATKDMKIASEKTGYQEFAKIYRSDPEFRKYVTDPNMLRATIVDDRFKLSGFKRGRKACQMARSRNNLQATDKELKDMYVLYNYHLGSAKGEIFPKGTSKEAAEAYMQKFGGKYRLNLHEMGNGKYGVENKDITDSIVKYKNQFFGALKDRGYSGVFDTHDGKYGMFHTNAPVIVFDNSAWVTQSAKRASMNSKRFDTLYSIGYRSLPLTVPAAAGVAAYKLNDRQNNNIMKDSERTKLTNRARSLYNSGLSQEEIAKKLGVSVTTVNSWLN